MLLSAAVSLMAGWKWEKLETGESPPICDNADPNLLNFHLAYDPGIEKLVFTYWNESTGKSDTWTFDGTSWSYVCTQEDSNIQDNFQFTPNQMFYDQSNNVLMDVRLYVCYPYPPHPYLCSLLCKKDDTSCWNCFFEYEATGLSTYDKGRNRAILFRNYFNKIFEWDGQQMHEVQLSEYYDADRVAYDEFSQRIIMHDWSQGRIMEFDGAEIQIYDGIRREGDGYWGMAYNPHVEGVVASFIGGNTYVYKNHKWQRLHTGPESEIPEFSYFGKMVYFPPTDQFLLLTIPWDVEGCMIFYELKRRHQRPFNK